VNLSISTPLFVTLIGLVVYLLPTRPGEFSSKLTEVGRLTLFVGLLWLVAASVGWGR
jgi:hypothetical protein